MTPIDISGIVLTVLFLTALFIGRIIKRLQDAPRIAYKALMIQIINAETFSDLCDAEIAVDEFYEKYYPECPQEMAAMSINLYTAINQRTEEFTGYVSGTFVEGLT